MNPRLRVEVGLQVDSEYEVSPRGKGGPIWLGRGGFCTIRIADPQLSRRHCKFVYDGERLSVEDLNSRNGTRVNGVIVEGPTELHHNDRVTVGSNVLVVAWPATSQERKAELAKLGTPAELEAAYRQVAALMGEEVAGCRVEEEVFNGLTSVVFRARELVRGAPVAIKVLKPLAKMTPADKDRLIAGARYGGELHHPRFVRILKGGQIRGLYFVCMEFAPGKTVETMVEEERGALDQTVALRILRQVLEGLQFAHEHGIVFGGVYGDNVVVDDSLNVKLADYDLVRPVNVGPDVRQEADDVGLRSLHVDNAFAAPEQIAYPLLSDPKSDVFSAGALAYFMLCGRPPFSRSLPGPRSTSAFSRSMRSPHVVNPAVSDAISGVIMQAMSEYSRFDSCEEMGQALNHAARVPHP